MEILLDTNFILTCAKEKIDFETIAEEIIDEKIEWTVPKQVINELNKIKNNKKSKRSDKDGSILASELLQKLNPKIVELNNNPNIDIAIVNYIKNQPITLATLDKNLKSRVQNNKILTIRGKNHLELT